MGNCFGFFNDSGPLLSNEESDEPTTIETHVHVGPATPIYHPHPGISIRASDLTEDEQIQIAKRIGMIQFLPLTKYSPSDIDKIRECIICMCDLNEDDAVRYLPCMHAYHRHCIDDWLMRSFVCPSCLRPVDLETVVASSPSSPPHQRHFFSSRTSTNELPEQTELPTPPPPLSPSRQASRGEPGDHSIG